MQTMNVKPKYPVGLQIFSKIREGDFVYIDKTELIYQLTHGDYRVVLDALVSRYWQILWRAIS
jgi:hypothetical protein